MFKVYNLLGFTNANSHKAFTTTRTMHTKSLLHQGGVAEHHGPGGRGGGLMRQNFTLSWFWKLEVWAHDIVTWMVGASGDGQSLTYSDSTFDFWTIPWWMWKWYAFSSNCSSNFEFWSFSWADDLSRDVLRGWRAQLLGGPTPMKVNNWYTYGHPVCHF